MQIHKWDLYWCRMPLKPEELKKIPINHQVRPYLIYKVEKQKIWGYPSSSKFQQFLNEEEQFFITRENHNCQKDSIINIQKLYKIPIENILNYAFTLTLEERNQFNDFIIHYNNQLISAKKEKREKNEEKVSIKQRKDNKKKRI